METVGDQVTEWTVGGRDLSSISDLDKLPRYPKQEEHDKMTKSQRDGVQAWNNMRERLILLGQMED